MLVCDLCVSASLSAFEMVNPFFSKEVGYVRGQCVICIPASFSAFAIVNPFPPMTR